MSEVKDKKINLDTVTGKINAKAIEIIGKNPEGVSWTELSNQIKEYNPKFHPKTVNGCVWLLAENFPNTVYKPRKGLFKLVKYKN